MSAVSDRGDRKHLTDNARLERVLKPDPAQGAAWDDRATRTIARARKMPQGRSRSDLLSEAGRLRIAAEMDRWLAGKL